MRLAEIHIFPVKSLAGHAVPGADVERCGLAQDRRWMVVDPDGRFLTQRVLPGMALVQVSLTPEGLALSLPGFGSIAIPRPPPDRSPEPVIVWRDTVPAADAGDRARDWLSAALGTGARLVHLRNSAARTSSSTFALPGETVSFADGFPVLLTSAASLAGLNARLAHPVPISRFRPNLVIDGAPPWAEDSWRRIRIGGATFRVAKPCDRCIVTTIDQQTGQRPDRLEPLRTLGSFRHDERGIMFGQNLMPEILGRIEAGDRIEILEHGPSNVRPLLAAEA